MCPPAIPAYTFVISTPAFLSASSIALPIDSMVLSRFITIPFRSPFEGVTPTPVILISSSPAFSPTRAQILLVPISSPTTKSSVFIFSLHKYFFSKPKINITNFLTPIVVVSKYCGCVIDLFIEIIFPEPDLCSFSPNMKDNILQVTNIYFG